MKGGTMMRLAATAAMGLVASGARRVFGDENIRRHINDFGGSAGYTQRSRGPKTKPKKHPNMRLVSKRVRRKHRRAAK